jgi:hypothetical protein
MPLWQLVQQAEEIINWRCKSSKSSESSDFALFVLLLQVKNEEIRIYWDIQETTAGLENTLTTCHGKAN